MEIQAKLLQKTTKGNIKMNVPLIIKSCNITDKGNADGIVEFNNSDFTYVIIPPANDEKKFDITIKGVDLDNLKKAGFEIDLNCLIEAFKKAVDLHDQTRDQEKVQYKEKAFLISNLHALQPVLKDKFSMMSKEEFVNSRSTALYAIYTETYRQHTKELSIFMDRDKFIVYDNLNRNSVSEPAITPEHVKEIIDEEIDKWKHKVDFKFLLQAHADEDSPKTGIEPLSATEYFGEIQKKEEAHEKEIIRNHRKYLKALGKLGEKAEMEKDVTYHENNTDTDTFHKKKILGSLSKEHLEKIRHPFAADDL